MIITFVGTEKGNNSAKKAAAMTAGLLSLANNKSVCLMQINYDNIDCVSYMIGKEMKESASGSLDAFNTTEILKGLDALTNKTNSMPVLSADDVYAATENLLKTENRLDVLGASKKENFDSEIRSQAKFDSVARVIKSLTASSDDDTDKISFYDHVVIYIPNNCPRIGDLITMSDMNICCIRQGEREEPLLNEKNNTFLITHFDERSIYNIKYIKKAYSKDDPKAKVFVMPHNVYFKDACIAQDLRRWLVKNYNPSIDEENYDFVHAMQNFVDYITDSSAVYEPEPTVKKKKKPEKKKKEKKVIKPEIESESINGTVENDNT